MNWERRGVLLREPPRRPWSASHVALPVVARTAAGELELYYSPRDARGRAHIARARLEVRPDGGLAVSGHDPEPVLGPGTLGAFDDAGVTVSCVVEGAPGQGTLLYYTGWALGVSVPFYFYAGLAVRPPGASRFERVSPAPLLERSAIDPYLTASPWVLREADGSWRMWYVSCARWEPDAHDPSGPPRHYYHVRSAHSSDGVTWQREGRVALDFAGASEYAMGRPCVLRENGGYRMWLCARGESYRLAYAESRDGERWTRDDDAVQLGPIDAAGETTGAGTPGGEASWDTEMQAYPAVFDWGERRYLLYNGNGYGRSGVGYAVSELGEGAHAERRSD